MRAHRVIILFAFAGALILISAALWRRAANPRQTSEGIVPPSATPIQQSSSLPTQPESPAPLPTIPPDAVAKFSGNDQKNIAKTLRVFSAPIEFYGKVLDETERPVSRATVHYSAADQYFGKGSKYEGTSDENGFFSIDGIKGAGLYVNVAKEGYYGTSGSGASFGYGMPSEKEPPTKQNPAIFRLRKKGSAEPLIHVTRRQYKVPPDGTPLSVDLKTGRVDAAGDIKFERWTNDQNKDNSGKFDWRCLISVPGGGLMERIGDFDFEAPQTGYQQTIEINMPATLGSAWKRTRASKYFLHLSDGRFARVDLTMYAGHNNFLVLESYLNPSGSRNLEYDPNKEINK